MVLSKFEPRIAFSLNRLREKINCKKFCYIANIPINIEYLNVYRISDKKSYRNDLTKIFRIYRLQIMKGFVI